jgi:hypothetical protein
VVWGVRPFDISPGTATDPQTAALAAARARIPKGARVICFDIAAPGSGVPSLINAITF